MLVIPEIRSTPCKGIMEEDFYWKNNILPCYDVFVDKEIFLCHHSSIEILKIVGLWLAELTGQVNKRSNYKDSISKLRIKWA